MGQWCSSNAATASGRTDEIPVPANSVEEVFKDIENAPNFIPHLLSTEVIRNGPSLKEGTQWREVRKFQGRNMTFYKTVTKIEKDPCSTTISVSVDFKETNVLDRKNAEIVSITIRPIDKHSCQIIWSIAFITVGFLSSMKVALIRKRFLNYIRKHIDQEISYYSKEAMRRTLENQQAQTKTKQ